MATIEEKLKEVSANADFDSAELQEFEKSSKEFEEMVSKGLIKRRGYTLLTIERASNPSLAFNVAGV